MLDTLLPSLQNPHKHGFLNPFFMSEQLTKTKGVVDIVFLLDVTGSMQPCIDALKNNIATFIDALTTKAPNNDNPVKHWRAKAVGYSRFQGRCRILY